MAFSESDCVEDRPYQQDMNINNRCSTPNRSDCRIPPSVAPPPPPKKKPFSFGTRKPQPPKNGYFHPPQPDLDHLFSLPPTSFLYT
ncbi:hypothetical protein Fmac_019729 [Flemingia macrophylla]|uniref:Uncharacterized protein n=1 Tax=Flemingia macrophylla TaxID=520843 RepID=A0ABD1M9E0_9FABA